MIKEENINIKIQNGEKLTLTEAISVLKCYHFDWRCSQALDVVLESINPWHYPSRGEYPTDEGRVLCKLCSLNGTGDWYECGGYDADTKQWFYESFVAANDPICWQYIVPPQEEA